VVITSLRNECKTQEEMYLQSYNQTHNTPFLHSKW